MIYVIDVRDGANVQLSTIGWKSSQCAKLMARRLTNVPRQCDHCSVGPLEDPAPLRVQVFLVQQLQQQWEEDVPESAPLGDGVLLLHLSSLAAFLSWIFRLGFLLEFFSPLPQRRLLALLMPSKTVREPPITFCMFSRSKSSLSSSVRSFCRAPTLPLSFSWKRCFSSARVLQWSRLRRSSSSFFSVRCRRTEASSLSSGLTKKLSQCLAASWPREAVRGRGPRNPSARLKKLVSAGRKLLLADRRLVATKEKELLVAIGVTLSS